MNRFAEDCGHPKGLGVLLRSRDANAWHGHHLAVPYALIGSGGTSNVRIPDESLAPCQVYMQAVAGRLFVCDLTGDRCLRAGEDKVDSLWLDLPADLQLDRFHVRVAGVEEDSPSQGDAAEGETTCGDPSPEPAQGVVDVEVQLRNGSATGPSVRSSKHVSLIGSSALCKFCVRSARVADVHCALVRTDHAVWLVDLGSGLGTSINGQPVALARLSSEVRLTAGDCSFDVRVGGLPSTTSLEIVSSLGTGLVPVRRRDMTRRQSNSETPEIQKEGIALAALREVVGELGRSQDQALEKTRQLMVEVLTQQERLVTSRVESLERQNEQLLGVLQTLLEEVRPLNGIQGPAVPRESGIPPIPPPMPTNEDVSEALERLDPDVHEAWLRGQLHTIADGLRLENDRGLRRLLRRLLPADPDDALR